LLSDVLLLVMVTLFGFAFITNATPFFGASYTLVATAELISAGLNLGNFALVVLATALGATLAKMVLYSGALGLRKKLTKNKNIRLFNEWLQRRSFFLALFVTAFIPLLPLDDYIYIGAGANKARLGPMLGVTFPAKIAKSAFEIFLEVNGILGLRALTKNLLGFSVVEFSILFSALFIVLGVALYKLDWEALFKKARARVITTRNV
jgi:hypothetical protein